MTKSKKAIAAEPQSTEQKKAHGLVKCMTCEHGPLHRYGNNPILAACLKQPQEHNERFPYQIEIANCLRSCSMYAEAEGAKEVEQREKIA